MAETIGWSCEQAKNTDVSERLVVCGRKGHVIDCNAYRGHEHKAALGDLVDAARGKVLQTETTNGQHVASEQRAEVARLGRAWLGGLQAHLASVTRKLLGKFVGCAQQRVHGGQ